MKRLSRKDLLSVACDRMARLSGIQSIAAWNRLRIELVAITSPENPRTPKYRDLFHAIRSATIHAKSIK